MKCPTCPTCKKAVTKGRNERYPFCTERCRLIDLGRWIDEDYRVPGEPGVIDIPDPDER